MGTEIDHARLIVVRWAGEEGAVFVEACFVVEEWIREVEVTEFFTIIEFDSYGMMGVLVDCPDESEEVEAEIASVASPGG